ncbi:MAG: hypothetical protein AAGJ28_00470 [Pseudomonadota bacterium]
MTEPGPVARVLAWAGLAGLGLLVWFGAVDPALSAMQGVRNDLGREAAMRSRLENTLLRLDVEATELNEARAEMPGWRGARIGEISASIQAAISREARRNGLALRSVTATEADDIATSSAAGLVTELQAPLDQATGFLRGLEGMTPPIIVRRINMRRVNRQDRDSAQPLVFLRLELAAPIVLAEEGE